MGGPQLSNDFEDDHLIAWQQGGALTKTGITKDLLPDLSAIKSPLPANEKARLEALDRYQILDDTPEELFDNIARLAASICSTPVALLSIVGPHRVWYKSKIGLTSIDTSRENSFCSWVILKSGLFVVPDAL